MERVTGKVIGVLVANVAFGKLVVRGISGPVDRRVRVALQIEVHVNSVSGFNDAARSSGRGGNGVVSNNVLMANVSVMQRVHSSISSTRQADINAGFMLRSGINDDVTWTRFPRDTVSPSADHSRGSDNGGKAWSGNLHERRSDVVVQRAGRNVKVSSGDARGIR